MTTLTTIRSRVLALLDDAGCEKYNTDALFTDVDAALVTAQLEVFQVAAGASDIFAQEASVTTTAAGVGDLTSIKPLRLMNVALAYGVGRLNILPARFDEAPMNYPGIQTLKVRYVARPVFPTPATDFVWGHVNVTSTALLEQLMCVKAGADLKVKEGEINKVIEKRIVELRDAVLSTFSAPGWSVMPIDAYGRSRRNSGLRYIMTAPDTLQLVVL